MKLLFTPGACSLAAHIVAREAGVDFELVKADFQTQTLSDGRSFKAVTKKAQVPALEFDDGTILTEGPAIQLYLADLAPQSHLAPREGTMERYRLIEWLNFLATELHKECFTPLFNPNRTPGYQELAKARLVNHLNDLNETLGKTPFLMGMEFTVADAYWFTMLTWLDYLQISLDPWKNLIAYREEIKMRPNVAAALHAESAA